MSLPSIHRDDGQLPLEVWDKVIDNIANSSRRDTVACCLVCRAFVPRSRFYLYKRFTLQSRTQLDQFIHTLSNSPILCTRLRFLIINAGNGADQSWVSTVPFRLPLSVSSLSELLLQDVDVSVMHPDALKAFSHIRIEEVRLQRVRYSSYNQLARFFSISNTVLVYGQTETTHEVAALSRLPSRRGKQVFAFVLSWATLGSMTRSLDLSTCAGNWDIDFYVEESSSPETSAVALANIHRVFEQVCGQPDRAANFCVRLCVGFYDIKLCWYNGFLISVLA